MKPSTKKSTEPAAAPITTPTMNPRELAMELLCAGSGVEVFVVLLAEDGGEADGTDDAIDVGEEDASASLDKLVCVGRASVVGAAEGVADPSVGAKTESSVAVSA